MEHIERTIRVKKTPEQVWDYLSDFRSTSDWDPGTVTTVRQSGDGGPGTVYHNTSKFLGLETEIVYTVIDVEPGRLIRLRGLNKSVTATDTITVEPDDGAGTTGTAVTYRAEFEFHGVAKLADPVAGIPLKKLGDDAEKNLTEALNRL
ncbi:MAG: SRPBCC family protein [Nocardioidaceae bacterium]|nr:SRPBCC family protein [Nocardioidaceae bacterium]